MLKDGERNRRFGHFRETVEANLNLDSWKQQIKIKFDA